MWYTCHMPSLRQLTIQAVSELNNAGQLASIKTIKDHIEQHNQYTTSLGYLRRKIYDLTDARILVRQGYGKHTHYILPTIKNEGELAVADYQTVVDALLSPKDKREKFITGLKQLITREQLISHAYFINILVQLYDGGELPFPQAEYRTTNPERTQVEMRAFLDFLNIIKELKEQERTPVDN